MISCPHCRYTARSEYEIHRHINDWHIKQNNFPCRTCGRIYGSAAIRNKHESTAHGSLKEVAVREMDDVDATTRPFREVLQRVHHPDEPIGQGYYLAIDPGYPTGIALWANAEQKAFTPTEVVLQYINRNDLEGLYELFRGESDVVSNREAFRKMLIFAAKEVSKYERFPERDPGQDGDVFAFEKVFTDAEHPWSYAAIKSAGRYYVTGGKSNPQGYTWTEFVDWLGEHCTSLRLMSVDRVVVPSKDEIEAGEQAGITAWEQELRDAEKAGTTPTDAE